MPQQKKGASIECTNPCTSMDGHGNNGKVIKENTEQTFQWRAATAAIAAAAAAKAASSGDGQSKTDHSKDNKTDKMNAKKIEQKHDKSSDTSGSSDSDDDSDSSSNSSSSSSDDSSDKKSSSMTQFSVMKSDNAEGGGLRMKIISSGRSNNNNNNNNSKTDSTEEAENSLAHANDANSLHKEDTDSSSSCSECQTDSDSSDTSHAKKHRTKKRTKSKSTTEKGDDASSSSGSPSNSSDTDDDEDDENLDSSDTERSSTMLKKSFLKTVQKPQTPPRPTNLSDDDGPSSSDMELPDLVTAAIQRVESGSDGEATRINPLAVTQYTSSLLHDFNVKAQMLGTTTCTDIERASTTTDACSINLEPTRMELPKTTTTTTTTATATTKEKKNSSNATSVPASGSAANATTTTAATTSMAVKKRGRPRKNPPAVTTTNSVDELATTTIISESPDSGIISTPHSPVQNDRRTTISTKAKGDSRTIKPKLNIDNLEKSIYATERILYPPRRKRNDMHQLAKSDEILDPAWREIDINKKFRRPSVSGYKSDGGTTVCSRVLAAHSDYLSDYGNVNDRQLSGYKSDYSCKSRRSGYRSDFSVKARSCGYRSDCSIKHRRKVRRKRRTKTATTKPSVNEQDLLMLAGLSLGQSEESSRDSVLTNDRIPVDTAARKRPMFRRKTFSGVLAPSRASSASSKNLLNSFSDRITKRIGVLDDDSNSSRPQLNHTVNMSTFAGLYKDNGPISKVLKGKPGMIRSRRSSAVSHCSSRCSTNSRHPFRRRRRKRLKSISYTDQLPTVNVTKLNLQIDQLANSFTSLCAINFEKASKEVNGGKSGGTRRNVKKRKGADNTEAATLTSTTTKRRHKKTVQDQSPDEHKLPLKKRHYLLTPGEKSGESKGSGAHDKDKQKSDESASKSVPKAAANKAVTPKKRHLLETPEPSTSSLSSTSSSSSSAATAAAVNDQQASAATHDDAHSNARNSPTVKRIMNVTISNHVTNSVGDGANGKISTQHKKNDTMTRKKNRLEGLVSKIQPTAVNSSATEVETSLTPGLSVIRGNFNETVPPPGVFEPSIDLELQIPYVAISLPSITKSEIDSPHSVDTTAKGTNAAPQKGEKVVEKLLNRTGAWSKRKRKKPNRTGFPTLKKKKKKPITPTPKLSPASDAASTTLSADNFAALPATSSPQNNGCDRVPSVGEPTSSFIERNARPRLTVISLAKLQGKVGMLEGRVELTKLTAADLPKRLRDATFDKSGQISKKSRNEILKTDVKETRDTSSDNEPLINIKHKNSLRGRGAVTTAVATPPKSPQSDEDEPLVDRIANKKPKSNSDRKSNQMPNSQSSKTVRPQRAKKIEQDPGESAYNTRHKNGMQFDEAMLNIEMQANHLLELQAAGKRKRGRPSKIAQSDDSMQIGDSRENSQKNSGALTAAIGSHKSPATADKLSDSENRNSKKPKLDKSIKSGNDVEQLWKENEATPEQTIDTIKSKETKRSKHQNVLDETKQKRGRVASGKDEQSETDLILNRDRSLSRMDKNKSKLTEKLDENNSKPTENSTNSKSLPNKKSKLSDVEQSLQKSTHSERSAKSIEKSIDPAENPKDKSTAAKHNKTANKHSTEKDESKKNASNGRKKAESIRSDSPLPKTTSKKHEKKIAIVRENDDYVYDESDIKPMDDNEYSEHEPLPSKEDDTFIDLNGHKSDSSDSKKLVGPKLRKKYLTAGLFSNHYKEAHPLDKAVRINSPTMDDQPISLLPPPLYCEKYFRQTQHDFQLPYDLWWAHENGKLPGRNIIQSWNFKKIRTNVYIDIRPNPSSDHQPCGCKSESDCGDDCLNRMVYTECNPETCPCGDKCQNTKIQRHIIAPGVERFMTTNKGWGVQAKQPIKKGTYISEYVGEVVAEREFKERMATLYVRDIHHYCLHLDGGLVIDGHRMGSDCRFVNHSCSPNCEMQKWSVNGLSRMALFASRDIQPNEELTYDYNFSLFNPAEGQPCRCESTDCRGVIGGKSQRVRPIEPKPINDKMKSNKKVRSGGPKKGGASKSRTFMHSKDVTKMSVFQLPTPKEQGLIANGHCFLLRNLKKIRRLRQGKPHSGSTSHTAPVTLTAQISALLAPRNIRTRGLTIAEHNPKIEKTARIAGVLREICEEISNHKDMSGQCAISKLHLPSKKKCPKYYEMIKSPIDMSTIVSNVEKGIYDRPSHFDADILRLFTNVQTFYVPESAEATIVQALQTIYTEKKTNVYNKLACILGECDEISSFLPNQSNQFVHRVEDPEEENIQCICGIYRDEGIMIQCSECKIWQHTECTGADIEAEKYLCEKCHPRDVNYEIRLKDATEEGYPYYLTLMRGKDLQVRQADTVYVLRDIAIKSGADTDDAANGAAIRKHTYETIGEIDYSECDIFRVERLWKNHEGHRFVFGHHYLRPHETFHEPSRKFYQNEVVRVPLYEVVPIELIMGRCWVMDAATFCKGRPMNSVEPHVYICELRVDKAARLFSKNSKNNYPVCTKTYAFNKFRQKLKITRNYLPHDVNMPIKTVKKRSKNDEAPATSSRKSLTPIVQLRPPPQKTLNEKRIRLETQLGKLMTKIKIENDGLQPIDLSYLLTGRGTRRRTNATNVPLKP